MNTVTSISEIVLKRRPSARLNALSYFATLVTVTHPDVNFSDHIRRRGDRAAHFQTTHGFDQTRQP